MSKFDEIALLYEEPLTADKDRLAFYFLADLRLERMLAGCYQLRARNGDESS